MGTARILAVALLTCVLGTACAQPLPPARPAPPVTRPPSRTTANDPLMPAVVGKRLPEAKELLTAKGYGQIDVVDDSGEGRKILEPLNWVVVGQAPEANSPAPLGGKVSLRVTKPTDPTTSPTAQPAGVIPHVVCLDLQSAQDAMRGAGFFVVTSEDASGQGRRQLVDRNWVVVRQSVPAGTKPEKSTRIRLGTVKFGEPTGDSGCRS